MNTKYDGEIISKEAYQAYESKLTDLAEKRMVVESRGDYDEHIALANEFEAEGMISNATNLRRKAENLKPNPFTDMERSPVFHCEDCGAELNDFLSCSNCEVQYVFEFSDTDIPA